MNDLIADIREYLSEVTETASWFCIVDDIEAIISSYEVA